MLGEGQKLTRKALLANLGQDPSSGFMNKATFSPQAGRRVYSQQVHAMPDLTYELQATGLVCGVDEAGRGPCAGPLCVAAVILNYSQIPKGIKDSKTLSEARRFALEAEIKSQALAFAVVTISPQDIDRLNVLQATFLGMQMAIEKLSLRAQHALIDGNQAPKLDIPSTTIVKGDTKSLSIAAASILAKTQRDRIMIGLDDVYPHYGFRTHKGYQTVGHLAALHIHGPSPVHRRTWATLKALKWNK
jgi:ribonuclease HII